ncbi:MAG: 6-pyruvoyl tetrahydropterin synthase family protein [Candidatus Hermodarchaeota archaeon]
MKHIRLVLDKHLGFSSAHFLVGMGKCDSIHGHNYRVILKLEGKMDEDAPVLVNFADVKKKLQEILTEWDHKILIPSKSKELNIQTTEKSVEITTRNNRYFLLPKEDVLFIDFPAASCEYLTIALYEKMKLEWPNFNIQVIVEETPGSKAVYGDF